MTEWRRLSESEFMARRRKVLAERRGIHGRDPLQGKRREIAAGATRIYYPHSKPCPVNAGDLFRVGKREIVIRSVGDRIKDGVHVWEAKIERMAVVEEPVHLRRVPPTVHPKKSELVDGQVPPPRPGDIERARRESSYTTGVHGQVPDAGAVYPDWEDHGMAERAERHQEVRREMRAEEEARRAEAEARAWLTGVIRTLPPEQRVLFVSQIRALGGDLLGEMDQAA